MSDRSVIGWPANYSGEIYKLTELAGFYFFIELISDILHSN